MSGWRNFLSPLHAIHAILTLMAFTATLIFAGLCLYMVEFSAAGVNFRVGAATFFGFMTVGFVVMGGLVGDRWIWEVSRRT